MSLTLFSLYIFDIILCLSYSSILIDTEEHIIKDDHFECVESPKTFTLKPNIEKKFAFIGSNSTDINQININEALLPQKMINFTDISYLNINPDVNKPICFYILYSKKDLIELKMGKKYNFYVLGDKYNGIKLEFELSDLSINKTIHLDISTKNNNTIFEYIYIYRKGNNYEYGNYVNDEDKKTTPLHKTIKIKISSYLKDTKKYDEFTIYFYMDGRVKYKSLVIAAIVFFYISIVYLFFVFIFFCDKTGNGKEEDNKRIWKFRCDKIGKRFKETYFWPCLKK